MIATATLTLVQDSLLRRMRTMHPRCDQRHVGEIELARGLVGREA